MRLSERSIRTYVKGFLPIVWSDEALSAYGGLELFSRYLVTHGWLDRLRSGTYRDYYEKQ